MEILIAPAWFVVIPYLMCKFVSDKSINLSKIFMLILLYAEAVTELLLLT